MPAAAVIPAPIAYIKVVAVKKLVVEPWSGAGGDPSPPVRATPVRPRRASTGSRAPSYRTLAPALD